MSTHAPELELNVAPGSVVHIRDEEWLVTSAEKSEDGTLVRVQGLSELVRDTTAAFYSVLDKIEVVDPRNSTVVADDTPNYRKSRLWLESTLRKTPTPLNDPKLGVSTRMLADTLNYQRVAVAKALDSRNVRPRILIADAVGLGKTLEIGMILSELVKRGRGERILIVTPRHVLEQMQHELWCRFALPFVRLDSAGIQKVRQVLPGTRNPFTYFKRAIISIDTLKSARYRAHLEKLRWDAVVIDESHNLTNSGTQNNELARVLAPNTEALILASATPHNGKNDSFAELIRLLDPTAVRPDGTFEQKDIEHLIIRRHRHSPEVAAEVGSDWAERLEPDNRLVAASPEENAVAEELSEVWLYPRNGSSPYSGQNGGLFPWTLAKAFLSSPAALIETVQARIEKVDGGALAGEAREAEALRRLLKYAEEALNGDSAKYRELVSYLKDIGVAKNSAMRAVIFAERVPTLNWLQSKLPKDLGLKPENVAILHGGLSDIEQLDIIDSFKRESSPIRVLVTGDVASEGVNLHAQCHHLIHFDIPWSLIRVEQRNGRIDRYGQKFPPQIATLLLEPDNSKFRGDLKVLTRLLERENEAHTVLQDVASLMGAHSVAKEEEAIREVLLKKKDIDDVLRSPDEVTEQDDFDAFFESLGSTEPVPESAPVESEVGLYATDLDYLDEALREAFTTPEAPTKNNGIGWTIHKQHAIAELEPPRDLQQRLAYLPQAYIADRAVTKKLKLATSLAAGKRELEIARSSQPGKGEKATTWPEAHFLGPLHPVLDWASDRALASLSRSEVLAVRGNVSNPVVLLMGTLMNQRGQVVSKAFFTVDFPDATNPNFALTTPLESIRDYLREVDITDKAINPGPVAGIGQLQELIPAAVNSTESTLHSIFDASQASAQQRLDGWMSRADQWQEDSLQATLPGLKKALTKQRARIQDEQRIAASLAPSQRLVRPLLVIVPTNTPVEGTN
ncbi:superfamily II DNA or RNA helicase [Arthrobacter sp. UYCu511]|uniref:helicase-related protein n=1 Tax=Arthrobacter sp. UYCu511 TaxID=3156337 RepID=UPI00339AF9DC